MKQKSGILAFLVSAVIIWLLADVINLPFIDITLGGTRWVTILIVAVVLGLINLILVSFVRGLFKKGSSAFIFVVTLAIDAGALWLTSVIMDDRLEFAHWYGIVLTAAILALVCTLAGLVKD